MVEFDEVKHQYKVDGKPVISVTQLMKKHGLAPYYAAVDPVLLERAAERGTMIHKEIEELCKTGVLGFTKEVCEFSNFLVKDGLKVLASEEIYYNDICAGTVDLVMETPHGEKVIADIKTTSILHHEAISWQLSIYNQLMGRTNDMAVVIHFDSNGKMQVLPVNLKPTEEVERLMQCERDGVLYQQNLAAIVTDQQIAAIEAAERIIAEAETEKKEAEARIAEIKTALMKAMGQSAVKTFETERIKLTYILPSERTTVDTTRLKKEMPEIAEQFSKTTKTAASLRITIKKED